MEKFNIVIGTHGRFGEELVNSARMIAGALENVQCCSLLPEYSFEDYMKLADETMCTKEGSVSYTHLLQVLHWREPICKW